MRRYLEGGRKALRDRRADNGNAKMDVRFLATLARVLGAPLEELGGRVVRMRSL